MRHRFRLALIVIGGLAAWMPAAAADVTSGIYLTATDYQKGQLSSEGDCHSKAHKLELHNVLNKPYIDVSHSPDGHRYAKSEIFGFRSCDGIDYRFFGTKEYQILEAKHLYIYSIQAPARLGKDTARGLNKVSTYYFSAGADGQVFSLTVNNLKQAVPKNHRFHDSLDQAFALGDVEQYDDFHKMFKVNRLLIASEER